jgi:dipeptidyl aminopeptidase/acylaminoacyl peptidase
MAATFPVRPRAVHAAALVVLLVSAFPAASQSLRTADVDRMLREQAQSERRWREASVGFMRMDRISYRSRAGDLDIPAFVFQPLESGAVAGSPALVWVHENIRGRLYEHYIPYVREAITRGYVVIAPEYRGSIGYGRELYEAIDYGGAEIDDVVSAADVLTAKYPQVDAGRISVIGWSHGGMIALLAAARHPSVFNAVAALVPVTNLFHRLAWKGVERQRQLIDPNNRFGGTPAEKRDVYRDRSPLFQVDKLTIPVLVHVADNDEDVTIEESMQLVDALRARKPGLAATKIYNAPAGGHMFDRRVDPKTSEPANTPEQRDSWNRVWAFLEQGLRDP